MVGCRLQLNQNTHVESVDNVLLDDSGAFAGRAKRICCGNVLYSGREWVNSDDISV